MSGQSTLLWTFFRVNSIILSDDGSGTRNLGLGSTATVGQKNLKSPCKKNLVNSKKSISRNFILTKFHFLQFQKWPKINFWTEKKFEKLPKMQFHEKFLIYLISRVFLPGLFLFSGPLCKTSQWYNKLMTLMQFVLWGINVLTNKGSSQIKYCSLVTYLLFIMVIMSSP